jgi:hypothetical protein
MPTLILVVGVLASLLGGYCLVRHLRAKRRRREWERDFFQGGEDR